MWAKPTKRKGSSLISFKDSCVYLKIFLNPPILKFILSYASVYSFASVCFIWSKHSELWSPIFQTWFSREASMSFWVRACVFEIKLVMFCFIWRLSTVHPCFFLILSCCQVKLYRSIVLMFSFYYNLENEGLKQHCSMWEVQWICGLEGDLTQTMTQYFLT